MLPPDHLPLPSTWAFRYTWPGFFGQTSLCTEQRLIAPVCLLLERQNTCVNKADRPTAPTTRFRPFAFLQVAGTHTLRFGTRLRVSPTVGEVPQMGLQRHAMPLAHTLPCLPLPPLHTCLTVTTPSCPHHPFATPPPTTPTPGTTYHLCHTAHTCHHLPTYHIPTTTTPHHLALLPHHTLLPHTHLPHTHTPAFPFCS